MFQTVREFKLSPSLFLASVGLHAAGILLLCLVSFPSSPLHPRMLRAVLLAPPLERPTPRVTKIVPPPRLFVALPLPPAPKLTLPPPELPPAPIIKAAIIPMPEPVRAPVPAPQLTPPPIKIGAFENPIPSVTTPAAPAVRPSRLEAAGFGAAETSTASAPTHALARASGFGDSQATVAAGPRRASVIASNFGDSAVAATTRRASATASANFGDTAVSAPVRHATASAISADTAVEILDKPKPAYTAEARRLNIQGEVLLEVVFEASGQSRVLRLIRGLGHGLDETAMDAARHIQFRPALREGAPIDSSAVVHINFQLAY